MSQIQEKTCPLRSGRSHQISTRVFNRNGRIGGPDLCGNAGPGRFLSGILPVRWAESIIFRIRAGSRFALSKWR